MLKLVKLNLEIEKLLKFDIEYNNVIQNFLYNKNWVTEIPSIYFEETKEKIENLIDENIDYTDEKNILFIESILEDIQKFSVSLTQLLKRYSTYNFSSDDWSMSLVFPDNPPQISPMDLPEPKPSNFFDAKNEIIIEVIKNFFNIGTSLYDESETLENILIKEFNIEEDEVEFVFAKAHLTYILTLHLEMIHDIGNFLKSITTVYNRRKSNIEENLNSFIPEDLKLEFDLTKTNLGHLFYNLYEIGIIAKDKTDVKDERTSLKNYINHANIFYLDKSIYTKAQKMTKAMPVARGTDSKILENEITFLNDLVGKLSQRIDSLTEKKVDLKKKGY
ncbi:hypothetical protein [Flavobacterium xueshanense]|uniref:Uncharacterized protein n=1 Tax=Flavobacterium xueshanense TaxID=935223 RepID=A0A1I2H060_9FLAO|nr:hypothetical protein [Flavobacterium xueshanense]SFF22689.1 hypothetical protein SAMN04488131_1124 [Flavobacterium xueshanense]